MLSKENIRERQDIVTRLLASENLNIVRHKKASAFFNLETRTIHKPDWDTTMIQNDPDASDLIDIHEVGHALYTPNDHKVTATLNVVEDWRIEKLLKRRFAGVAPIFARGYSKLFDFGFFGELTIDKVNSMGLLDRLNIRAKLGFLFPVEFNDKEMEIVRAGDAMETWQDVLDVVAMIKKLMKEQKEQEPKESTPEGFPMPKDDRSDEEEMPADDTEDTEGTSLNSDSDGEEDEDSESSGKKEGKESEDEEAGEETSRNNQGSDKDSSADFEPKSETIDSFEKKMDGLISNSSQELLTTNVGRFVTEFNYKAAIGSLKEKISNYDDTSSSTKRYAAYEMRLKKTTDMMVREHELRKNASERMRDRVSNTGKIDTKRLAKYKLTDKIFKQITTKYEGKNHGFVFYLDMSGSMSGRMMESTVDQLLTLSSFCDKTNIPYMIFGYTTGTSGYKNELFSSAIEGTSAKIRGQEAAAQLLLDSTLRQVEKNTARRMLWQVAYGNYYRTGHICFSGTPSITTLVMTENIIHEFFTKNRVEKRNIVFMTDGAPCETVHAELPYNPHGYKQDIVDSITKKRYESEKVDDRGLFAVLDIVGTRTGSKVTYIQLIQAAKEVVMNPMFLPAFVETLQKRYNLEITDRYLRHCYKVPDNEKLFWNPSMGVRRLYDTVGPAFLIEEMNGVIKNKGFVKVPCHGVETFFIKTRKMSSDKMDALINGDTEGKTGKQLGKSLASAMKSDAGNRQLVQALAENFNYF